VFDSDNPPKEPIVEPGYLNPNWQGDEGTTKYFSGKSWKGLDVESLRLHESAMYIFTPEAHNYYLPAFMLASLKEPLKADIILDNLMFHFAEYKTEFWWKRISMLTPEQCEVVGEFIIEIADEFDHKTGHLQSALKGLKLAKELANKAI
jgi:hypothetical protein